MNKTLQKKNYKISLIVLSIMLAIVSIIGIFSNQIDRKAQNALLSFGVVSGNNNLLVHYISVGQGDAIAINLPDGKVMLIDTGTQDSANLVNYINEKVLNTKRNKAIDYLVLTHPHEDHIGGAVRIINEFDVGLVYMPVLEHTSKIYKSLKETIENKQIKSISDYSGLEIETGCYSITVFAPFTTKDLNNSCPIIKLEYLGYSFLFTGDVEAGFESKFVEAYGELLDCDILKVAHHGSNTSSSTKFLTCVTPKYAVISCGVDNQYGHPNDETLIGLYEIGAKVYRTDLLGDVMFVAGNNYGLVELDGDYVITAMEFKFVYIILIADAIILINIVVIVWYMYGVGRKQKGK